MGRLKRLRFIQKPLGDRGLLQADQTDLTGLRLPRAFQASHPLATLVGSADVFAAALPGVVFGLAPQLRTHFHDDPRRGLGSVRLGRDPAILWDSRWSLANVHSPANRISAGFCSVKQWDSIRFETVKIASFQF